MFRVPCGGAKATCSAGCVKAGVRVADVNPLVRRGKEVFGGEIHGKA